MNRTLSNVLIFAAGAAIGSAVTWRIFKSRYEVVEDSGEYEDYFENDNEEASEDESPSDSQVETRSNYTRKPPLKEYAQMVKQLSYADVETPDADEEDEDVYEPYVISPDSYGEIHDYETLDLNYYADGVLTDELNNPIEDVESMVPADFANHFGDFEDDKDTVYIRNDERKCDYAILRDNGTFAEVVGDDSYPLGDE